jgi:hypothetical protein
MTDLGTNVDDFVSPPKRKPGRAASDSPSRTPPTERQIREALDQTWVGLSIYVGSVRGDLHCSAIVAEKGPDVTAQLLELAKVNKSVKRALEAYATTGAWGGVIGSVMSMALPIMAHHDRLPAGIAARFNPPSDDGADATNPVAGPPSPVDMGAGGTRHFDRPDGMRQDNAGKRDSGAA